MENLIKKLKLTLETLKNFKTKTPKLSKPKIKPFSADLKNNKLNNYDLSNAPKSTKDPMKVAQQSQIDDPKLKEQQKKIAKDGQKFMMKSDEIIKIDSNGQWSLSKNTKGPVGKQSFHVYGSKRDGSIDEHAGPLSDKMTHNDIKVHPSFSGMYHDDFNTMHNNFKSKGFHLKST